MKNQEMELNPSVIFDTWRLEEISITTRRGVRTITAYTNGNQKYALEYDRECKEECEEAFFTIIYLCDVQDLTSGTRGGLVNAPDCLNEKDRSVICSGVVVEDSSVSGDTYLSATVRLKVRSSNICNTTITAEAGTVIKSSLLYSTIEGMINILQSTLIAAKLYGPVWLTANSSMPAKDKAEKFQLTINQTKIAQVNLFTVSRSKQINGKYTVQSIDLLGIKRSCDARILPTLFLDDDIIVANGHEEFTIAGEMSGSEINQWLNNRAPEKTEIKRSHFSDVAAGILGKGDENE